MENVSWTFIGRYRIQYTRVLNITSTRVHHSCRAVRSFISKRIARECNLRANSFRTMDAELGVVDRAETYTVYSVAEGEAELDKGPIPYLSGAANIYS